MRYYLPPRWWEPLFLAEKPGVVNLRYPELVDPLVVREAVVDGPLVLEHDVPRPPEIQHQRSVRQDAAMARRIARLVAPRRIDPAVGVRQPLDVDREVVDAWI